MLNGISNDVHLENSNGAVEVHVNKLGGLDIKNVKGDIRIFVPAKSGFQLEAQARDGEIQTDFTDLKINNGEDHKLLDSTGFAKLGGMQRDGSVAVERYISYRRGKDIVSLGVFLRKDQPVETHEFHVIAPLALLDGGKPIAAIRPAATDAQKQTADGGLAFTDLPSAAAAFEAALAKIAA